MRLGDQLQHLELARGQDVEVFALAAPLDVVTNECGDRGRIEERIAAHRDPARVDDVGIGGGLEHISGGAGLEGFEQELLAVVHRQHQNAQLGLAFVQLGGGLDPGHARHPDVQNHEVDVFRQGLFDRLVAVLGFGDDLEVGLGVEQLA